MRENTEVDYKVIIVWVTKYELSAILSGSGVFVIYRYPTVNNYKNPQTSHKIPDDTERQI